MIKSRAVLGLALATALAGCISVLPKEKPVPLYRFGASSAANAAIEPSPTGRTAIRLAPIGFTPTSSGDRILTVEGDRAAYVRGGRWVGPAISLFESAVVQTFDARPGQARLAARGEIAPVGYLLKLDVRRFEARYDSGGGAPPVAVVEVYAALDAVASPGLDQANLFTARVPAADNRIGPIADAFDRAVDQVLVQVVDWTNTAAK